MLNKGAATSFCCGFIISLFADVGRFLFLILRQTGLRNFRSLYRIYISIRYSLMQSPFLNSAMNCFIFFVNKNTIITRYYSTRAIYYLCLSNSSLYVLIWYTFLVLRVKLFYHRCRYTFLNK